MDGKDGGRGPLAVVLAGGLARRMGGGDKPLVALGGQPLLRHILDRLAPQVSGLALNANGDPARYRIFGLPILPDSLPDHPGPLVGILAALDWAAATGRRHVLTVPGDTPFLPTDLVLRLEAAIGQGAPATIAVSGGRRHPVVGLWPAAVRDALRRSIVEGERRVDPWARSLGAVQVDFAAGPVDPFFNLNGPDDLVEAERLLAIERSCR
ncbi:MAG TPA: molybdenum cofactor guanylyltransferase MobA [Aliidongia sp.]|uniref:molybdenum cofactor guanylyltransferase MobA n=1 Tax=Aliidongia sp. TaxID=1914230 RepID=UPI002DDD0801|nr:molybdenum cofactor guanylyltransferase MobA [Aliidongia sp.]HEV2673413.1 molybdenum cofactor guanylyltransferase MobA [Aliidongia sp.]